MAEINVNLSAAKAAGETLKQANDKITAAKTTMDGNPFQALCSTPDLASSLINELKTSFEDIVKFSSNNIYPALNKYLDDLDGDEQIEKPSGGGNYNGGGGSGSGDIGDPEITDPQDPNDGEEIDPNIATAMSALSLNDLDGVVDSLKDMSVNKGKGIDEILMDEKMADSLRELLLSSPYLSKELKELLQNADSQIVRQTFLEIMQGKHPDVFALNPLNVGIVYSQLNKIAKENGITLEQLLSDPKYAELLKDSLSGFGDTVDLIKGWETLSPEECQKELLDIYDGNGIEDKKPSAVDIVRNFVDYISEATEINTEELLTDTKYAGILQKATQEFGKTATLIGATANYTTESAQEVVGNLFNGKNPGALGMTDEEVTSFQGEIDNLAKENGVTAKTLLTDSNYADAVKEALANSDNAKEVGTIFAKQESTVSQNVAKNLYDYEIAEKNTTSTTSTT